MYHRPKQKLNRPSNYAPVKPTYHSQNGNAVISESIIPIRSKLNGQKLPDHTNLGISTTRFGYSQSHACVILPPSQEQPGIEKRQHLSKISTQGDGLLTIRNLTKQLQLRSDKAVAASFCQPVTENVADENQPIITAQDITVDRLNLDRRGLKSIPALIEDHINLKLLNLQHNSIQKIDNLSMLKRLIFIDLYDNDLDEIANLESVRFLRVLMLGKNRIKQIRNLDQLSKLDVLDLHCNQISRIENLNHLTELRVLNLAGNQISYVSNIGGLCSLQELNLRKNQITKVDEVNLLPKLQRLFLDHNKIASFSHASSVLKCGALIELTLEDNPMIQSSKYRSGFLIYLQNLKILDGKKISMEERRTSAIMARKAEEKQQERHKAAIMKEKKRLAIINAQKEWEMKMRLEFGNSNHSVHDGYDGESEGYNSDICNTSQCRKSLDTSGRMADSYLIDIEENSLHLFGTGALEGVERLQLPSTVHTISFKYISFDDIIPYLVKLKNRFRDLRELRFSNNNLRHLSQLNTLSTLDSLDHLIIEPEGNSLVHLQLWKYYALFRLSNLQLQSINHKEITSEDINTCEMLFNNLMQATTSCYIYSHPKSVEDLSKSATISLLKYQEPSTYRVQTEEYQHIRSALKSIVHKYTEGASKINRKLSIVQRFWPYIIKDMIQEAVHNTQNIDDYMQSCLETLERPT
ncbi:uncharacterized protein TRIADDRAFT_54619 [Trichoplax adhaerens]|uniref:Leucine-rich repeat-containing protein 49 n=1 Tax=Trichoplax adhaerens TaxID=10228 RepID=B3RSJ4_TRIAD|nr:hypothetical protein TRIADDRAFT_54619 [Trichoplax adhaerens]EDV27069.1 hypothetical protein TRIADDRAFT_54619 [Trichoplax adhaerens]|eukprot:XP_002111065.1 hypothetical protein TRIADDRAFT_54619 [Trichoplax adhaerens]